MAKKNKLPFEGIRIVDVSMFWAGPYTTSYLGALGAEVIKIESIQRPDTYRFGSIVCDLYWELCAMWNCANTNKYGITLDLTNTRGIELFKELVKISDIVIDNFPPRVMKNFGLTYDVLKQIKPDIIVASLPGYGLTGPWSDYIGFGLAFEQGSGVSYITGYKDGFPLQLGGAADPIAGMHAAFAIQAALEYRRKTGKGQLIDVSQTEVLTNFMGPAVIDYSLNKRIWERMGNQDPVMAPHGVFPCKEADSWVAIAVASDDEWKAFCKAIGKPGLADDEKFATVNERWKNQEELNNIIGEWTKQYMPYEAMEILQKAGIAAGTVNPPDVLLDEPQLQNRGYFYELERDVIGKQRYYGFPVKFSETKMKMRPAPKLGEHNNYVLSKILKLSKEEIEELEKNKIIGNYPLAMGSLGV
jgi:crotonobetainyl-CoA:carnitine CoA-transferase CaiB-like acyl-CoA transferase